MRIFAGVSRTAVKRQCDCRSLACLAYINEIYSGTLRSLPVITRLSCKILHYVRGRNSVIGYRKCSIDTCKCLLCRCLTLERKIKRRMKRRKSHRLLSQNNQKDRGIQEDLESDARSTWTVVKMDHFVIGAATVHQQPLCQATDEVAVKLSNLHGSKRYIVVI